MWNRHPRHENVARRFEAAGANVIVVENGYMGKAWLGRKWFAMAVGHHAGAGQWRVGSSSRWDSWDVQLEPVRPGPGETVILGQRHIGEIGIASPEGWEEDARARYGGRIRRHPGSAGTGLDLLHDLRNAVRVVTWASGAALLALLEGIEVVSEFPKWIGAGTDRLEVFRRMAWAMWTAEEVESGEAFQWLLR